MSSRLVENPVNVFITFDEVMRDQNTFIIHLILDNENIRKQLESYIDLSIFECQSEGRIRTLLLNRDKKNILEWLSKKPFDYEVNYQKMYSKFPRMYEDSPPLDMYRTVSRFLDEPFVRNVFVYGRSSDVRVVFDLKQTFGKNDKLHYVTGPYLDAISAIGKIDLFIDNDVERLAPVMYMPEHRYATFMVARYGYNYEFVTYSKEPQLKGDVVKHSIREKINLVEFLPFKVNRESISNG